jgi:hypothetical protein
MATPETALRSPREVAVVLVEGPPTRDNPSGITIIPYSFRVSKSEEEVMWFCLTPGAEFEVNFIGDTPFGPGNNKFTHHSQRSGRVHAIVEPGAKEYKYTVTVNGKTHNTPSGQVDN